MRTHLQIQKSLKSTHTHLQIHGEKSTKICLVNHNSDGGRNIYWLLLVSLSRSGQVKEVVVELNYRRGKQW